MADNIIRHDIIKVDFDINDSPLQKISKEVDGLSGDIKGTLGKDTFSDFEGSAAKASKGVKGLSDDIKTSTKNADNLGKSSMSKLETGLKKVKEHLTNIGKKASVAAFNGLKKVASVSFKALGVGLAATATAIGGVVAKSVSAFADYEQNIGGVQKLFGAGGQSIEDYAKKTGKSVDQIKGDYDKLIKAESTVLKNASNSYILGFDANQYMETTTSFSASLISDLKGDTQKAAELSDMAIRDMADNANVFGTDLATVQQVYQGLAKDQYMLLDNLKLGYGGSKEGAKQLVADAAKIDKSIKGNDLSFSNMVKAINVIQKDMGIYEATAKEASGTVTGSLNATKAAWGNLLIAIGSGENLDQCIDNMVNAVETFGGNIIPVAEKALGGVGILVERLAPIIEEKLPSLIETLLPPLIKAATGLLKGLVRALPSIVKTVAKEIPSILSGLGQAIAETFTGKEFSSKNIALPIIGTITAGLLAIKPALKAYEGIKKVKGLFGGGSGSSGGGGSEDIGKTLSNPLTSIAKVKPTTILKGLANIAIIVGGLTLLAAGIMALAPHMAKLSDAKSLIEVITVIGVLGVVGGGLAKLAGIVGNIPVSTIAKGLANIAIIVGGLSALYLLIGAVSLINFDLNRILKITAIIGVLGTVGAALTLFAGIVGLIPVPVVALGLANMAIVIGGMSALFLLIGATSLLNFDYTKIMTIVKIIGVLGAVGGALSVFAGIVGMIPIPVVLAGLTNIGLVLGGMTAIIVAFGALTKIGGFTEFLEKGGEVLAKICGIIGEMAGSLIGGIGEGLSNSLPTIGENIGKFGENIKPLFTSMQGVDMGGVGTFFKALIGLFGLATGNDVIEGIKSFFGGGEGESPLAKMGTQLSEFATKSKGFFDTVATIPENAFVNGQKVIDLVNTLCNTEALKKDNLNLTEAGTQLDSFAHSAQSALNCMSEYPEIGFTNATKLAESISGLSNLTFNTESVDAYVNALKTAQETMDSLVTKTAELPSKMSEAIKSSGESFTTAFVEMWTNAVKACVAPANKLISGANWILKQFGSTKVVASWTPYTRGTNGHKGGNALVNDGRGAELVQMPNGNTFIPKGRNVFIPNAPKGMKVLPAEQTAKFMGKNSPTFHYANGTGEFDIYNYENNPKGLIDYMKKKHITYDASGFPLHAGKALVTMVSGEMVQWAKKLFDEFGGGKLVATCRKYLGVPYVWGGTSPSGFDCSGLMQYVYAECGKAIPRVAAAQFAAGKPVANPRRGDLVFFKGALGTYSAPGHVGMYIGNGQMIHAPRTGDVVKIAGAFRGDYLGARRYANGGIATKPSIFGEAGAEMAIPLNSNKRKRAIELYNKTGDILGLSAYANDNGSSGKTEVNNTENNTYNPVFNLTINGGDDRTNARKVKKWVREAFDEMFESMDRRTPVLQEY